MLLTYFTNTVYKSIIYSFVHKFITAYYMAEHLSWSLQYIWEKGKREATI